MRTSQPLASHDDPNVLSQRLKTGGSNVTHSSGILSRFPIRVKDSLMATLPSKRVLGYGQANRTGDGVRRRRRGAAGGHQLCDTKAASVRDVGQLGRGLGPVIGAVGALFDFIGYHECHSA